MIEILMMIENFQAGHDDDDDANDEDCNYDDDDESDEEYHWPKLIESTVKTRTSPWFHIVSLWRGEEHWYLIYMIMINMMVMMSAYITTTTTTTTTTTSKSIN